MANAGALVERYFDDFWGGDRVAARGLLADDLSFSGPAVAIEGAEAYFRATEHARRGVKDAVRRRVFVDNQDVCIWYDLLLDGPVDSAAVAEWYHVENEKIASVQTILDTAPFARGPRPIDGERETAVDPVCHMTVEMTAAAAARIHQGSTFYFCNAGCARAFDEAPERYVTAQP